MIHWSNTFFSRNLEALQYHKPKCKKVPSSKNPDSDVPKKAKLENTKSEVIKNDPDNSSNNQSAANNTDRVTSSTSSSSAPPSGENETKPKIENNQNDKSNEDTDIFDVAKTMIGLRNDSGHENHENGQPPSLNAPPALAKRPDNPKLTPADKKRENHHMPPSIHQPTMPRLVKKPPIEGAGSLPPMPSLQPKPGLMTHQGQTTTAVLTSTSQSASSVPVVQNQSAPGTPLKPRISPNTTPVVLPIDPANDPKLVSINPIGGETTTQVGGVGGVSSSVGGAGVQKRTRSPPFQPVTETSVSPTPNPR